MLTPYKKNVILKLTIHGLEKQGQNPAQETETLEIH